MENLYNISFLWDGEAGVWVATSEDVPGLVLEDSSFDVLAERLCLAVPELLELNCGYVGSVNMSFTISRCERLVASG